MSRERGTPSASATGNCEISIDKLHTHGNILCQDSCSYHKLSSPGIKVPCREPWENVVVGCSPTPPTSCRGTIQALAFVRLPTEEEWEYAARGGAAVSDSGYLAPTWPMPEGPERYAVAGAGMSDGQAQQVGQLLPESARPLRHARQCRAMGAGAGTGSTGSAGCKGCRAAWWRAAVLRDAARRAAHFNALRDPPYDPAKKAPTRLGTVGFRVMLSTVAGGGLQDVAMLRQAFESLQHGTAAGTDPRTRIEQLKQLTPDQTLRRALDGLSAELAADEGACADAGRQTVRAELNAATALCYVVWRIQHIIDVQQSQLRSPEFRDLQTGDMV